jgi:hypothetical protein
MLGSACEEEKSSAPVSVDSGIIAYNYQDTEDDKSPIFPLVGRWYPVDEVKRLSDRGLTAEEWCSRPAEKITIEIDKARVQCDKGTEYVASIAEVKTSSVPDTFIVSFRTAKDAPLRRLVFSQVLGIVAQVSESPCSPKESVVYQRFPEYDVLRRKIVEGRPCSLVTGDKLKP